MDREILDEWSERGILCLVLAALIYAPLMTGAVLAGDFLVVQGLTIGAMLLWGVRLWIHGRVKLLWPPVCWAVLAFVIYAVGRYLAADIEYAARQEMIRVLVYAAVFFLTVNNLHGKDKVQTIVFVLIFFGMLVAGYAVVQFVTNSNRVLWTTTPYTHRGTGTFISPNNLAGFLELLIPLGLAYTLTSRSKLLTKILLGYASLVMLAGLVVTVSRGGWAACGVSLLVFFFVLALRRSYRLPALFFLLLIIGAGIYFIPHNYVFVSRLQETSKDAPQENYSRFDIWRAAVEMWQENKVWGVGPAHFDYRFRQFRPQTLQARPHWTHNDYLNALADWGIVGAGIIACALVLLAGGIVKTWREAIRSEGDLGGRPSNKFALLLGAMVALIAIAVHSLVDFNMHIPANALVVVTLMALLSAHLRFATSRYWFRGGLWAKSLVTIVLLGGVTYLGSQELRGVQEQFWLRLAARAPEQTEKRIAMLKSAYAFEPQNPETPYNIGETYRLLSWTGGGDYQAVAQEAEPWFERVMKLNKFDPYGYLGYGLCEDWIGHHAEAWPFYLKALECDPNSYYVTEWVAWHYVQVRDFPAARIWFERSERLEWSSNTMAATYIPILEARMKEAATNSDPFRMMMQQ